LQYYDKPVITTLFVIQITNYQLLITDKIKQLANLRANYPLPNIMIQFFFVNLLYHKCNIAILR